MSVLEDGETIVTTAGSVPLSNFILANGTFQNVVMRKGRILNLAALQQRQQQIDQLNPKEKL